MILWLTLIRIQGEGCVLHILRKGRVQAWAGTGVSRVSSVCVRFTFRLLLLYSL